MLLSFIWTSENLFQSCLIIFDFSFHWSDLQSIIFFSIPTFFLWISISFSLTNFLFWFLFSFFSYPRLFFFFLSSPFLSLPYLAFSFFSFPFLFFRNWGWSNSDTSSSTSSFHKYDICFHSYFIFVSYPILSYPILSSFLLSDIHRLLDILDLSSLDQYCSDDINVFDDK